MERTRPLGQLLGRCYRGAEERGQTSENMEIEEAPQEKHWRMLTPSWVHRNKQVLIIPKLTTQSSLLPLSTHQHLLFHLLL